MDSLSIFKGYCKVAHNLEGQPIPNPNPNPIHAQKRLISIITVSFTLVLTLILCLLVVALINESNSESEFFESSSDAIEAVCSVTHHPDSCFSSLSSVNAPAADPELIFLLSLRIAITELSKLSSLRENLSHNEVNDLGSKSALRDCWDLFDDALSRLNDSVSEVVMEGEKLLTEKKIGDIQTWISGAMTDQETCLDGLEEMRSTVVDEVKGAVHKSSEYMSNSLAILVNMQTLLHKFDLTIH